MPSVSARSAFSRLSGRLDRLRHPDATLVALLTLVPLFMYAVPSALGHPILPGDDLTQNEPLRVLVGNVMRSGRLPAWDPLIWSGSPLLAGWNAGAMFPFTWLFIFLPNLLAWTLNLAVAPLFGSVGFYLLARRLSCRPLSALLGSLVFTYTGFFSAQTVHLGLVQGTAMMPWMVLAIDGLARRPGRATTAGWIALLGASLGLCVLAGDPRAVSNAAIVCALYLLAVCRRAGRAFILPLVGSLAGALLGVVLSAIQWLPGLGFVQNSQRGAVAYEFFGSGSLSIGHIVTMVLVPFLFGGNQNFLLTNYAGPFNLPEVTIGCGLVALVALLAYLPELLRFTRRRGGRKLGVWYAMVTVGVLLTLGVTTPLGSLLVHIPFFGGQRLQNRNAAIVDLALAVLVTFFVDDIDAPHNEGVPVADALPPLTTRAERLLALIPPVLAGALLVDTLADPGAVSSVFSLTAPFPSYFATLRAYIIVALVGAFALGVFVAAAKRLPPRRRRAWVVVFVLIDVGTYLLNGNYSSAPSSILGASTPLSRGVSQLIGTTGRFAIYNPGLLLPSGDPNALYEAGVTDLNVVQANPSVQGYGSVVNGIYQNVTETHDADDINTARLLGQSFDTLDLRVFFALPAYFEQAVSSHAPIPLSNGQLLGGSPGVPAPALAPLATGPWPLLPGQEGTWQLAAPTHLTRVGLTFQAQLSGYPKTVRITASTATGRAVSRTVAVAKSGDALLRLPKGFLTTTVGVANLGKVTGVLEAVVAVTTRPSARLVLDGALQGENGSSRSALLPPQWRYAGTVGPLVAYENTETRGLAWLQPPTSGTPNAAARTMGHIRVVTNAPVAPQVMEMDTPTSAILVRSEEYAAGWTARLTPTAGGRTLVLPVHRFGLVQAVTVPAGSYTVTWRYAPTGLLIGLILSIVGFAILVLLVFVHLGLFVHLGRRRRADSGRGGSPSEVARPEA